MMSNPRNILLFGFLCSWLSSSTVYSQETTNTNKSSQKPIHHQFEDQNQKYEYTLRLPQDFDSRKTCWGLVTAHGGGGNGKTHWLGKDMRRAADQNNLQVIVISPSFPLDDPNAQQFPVLGGTSYLKAILKHVRKKYSLHPKVLLAGSSRGGQFAHRFALGNPDLVAACVPIASGTWTTPDGRFLLYAHGEVKSPETFLTSSPENLDLNPKQHIIFSPRVAKVASQKAAHGANRVPFLVVCGTRDPRIEMAQLFSETLKKQGFQVETLWTNTKHGGGGLLPDRSEYYKYSQTAVQFFQKITTNPNQ